jgi:hypothetical protein
MGATNVGRRSSDRTESPALNALSLEEEAIIIAFARSVVGHDPGLDDVRYLVPAGEMVRARRPPRRARRRRQMRIVCACREYADRGASNAADAESSIAPRPSRPCSVPWQETRLSFRLQEALFPTRADTAYRRDPCLVAAIGGSVLALSVRETAARGRFVGLHFMERNAHP